MIGSVYIIVILSLRWWSSMGTMLRSTNLEAIQRFKQYVAFKL